MKIGLLTTLQTNIGDDFIREGIINTLKKLKINDEIEFVAVNKHEPFTVYTKWQLRLKRFIDCRPSIWRLRDWAYKIPFFPWSRFDSCDLIIQCGTPVLWHSCRNSEWATPIWIEVMHRLSKSNKPILNIGGGATYPWEKRPDTLLGDEDEGFVRLMLSTCQLTTARDQLAKKLFRSLGYETEVICCPALLAGQFHTRLTDPTRKVVINFMAGGGHYDWGQGIDNRLWEETMKEVIRFLIAADWNVVMLAHDIKEHDLAKGIWPDLPCVQPKTVGHYFEFIRDAAFGVFNRMHASIAAAGLGIPSVAVGTDARNLMVAETGLPVFYVKDATVDCILNGVKKISETRSSESIRLLALRQKTYQRHEELLTPFVRL